MTTDKENIRRTFAIFHDGTICGFEKVSNVLKIKIDCYYLSERINSEFECFYVEIIEPTELEFEPWSDKGSPRNNISDLGAIGQWEYNIFTCKIENGNFNVDVEVENPKTSLIGGSLKFNCNGIKIYDQSETEITFDQLDEISNEYWTEFETKTE